MEPANRGRGRGRGRGAMLFQPTQNPGGGSKAASIDQLVAMVDSLAIDADGNEITTVTDTAMKMAADPANQEEITKMLYTRCVKDWKFSHVAADICNRVQHIQAGDSKFRDLFLRSVQADFNDKGTLRENYPEKVVGCISLMCQLLYRVKLSNGEIQKVLVNPALEGLEMCLDNSSTALEIECSASQLTLLGPTLTKEADPIRLKELKQKIKDKLINGEGSVAARSQLFDCFEGLVSEWKHQTVSH